jgi:hypothetical protein
MKTQLAAVSLLTAGLAVVGIGGRADKATAFGPASINQMIRAEWKKENVIPAPPVDDARFLRRAYLDITGSIPPPEAVTAFLADRSPDKRSKAIDGLLNSPKYSDQWTNYWDNVLMGRTVRSQVLDRVAWRQWLHSQFEKNAPWNKFVYDLITATGVNSTGGSYAKVMGLNMPNRPGAAMLNKPGQAGAPGSMEMSMEGGDGASTVGGKVNGAVNWQLKYAQNPADLSGTASKVFLGVQIQCAQCHDHKTEKWKQDDFRKLTACFMNTRPRPVGTYEKGSIRQVDLEDFNRPFMARNAKAAAGRSEYLGAQPAALDGTDFSSSSNRRVALATWMTAPDNPWFAEAIVNRVWSHFMGRGFVEPVDDFRPSNPAIMPDLLKKLSDDFVAHDYDLKYLIKQVCATEVYQLSSQPAKQADITNKLWARYRLKPMGPEQLLDSLVTATSLGPVLEKVAGGNIAALKFGMMRQLTFLFDVDEEFEQKDFEGTIPQALLLLNSNLTNRAVTPIPGTALADVLQMQGSDRDKIESLYLRTVSRKPTPAEINKWTAFLNEPRDTITDNSAPEAAQTGRAGGGMFNRMQKGAAKGMKRGGGGPDPLARIAGRLNANDASPKEQAYEDLFWALLNSSEFIFNH